MEMSSERSNFSDPGFAGAFVSDLHCQKCSCESLVICVVDFMFSTFLCQSYFQRFHVILSNFSENDLSTCGGSGLGPAPRLGG